jgi:trimethylamine-N-oxide reductase (cytochrome c)
MAANKASKWSTPAADGTSEKTFIKGMALGGHSAMPACVDVKDGKIVRIRPLHHDWKYNRQDLNPWKIEARGSPGKPISKGGLAPFSLAYKKRIYSPNRIKYPLKELTGTPTVNAIPRTAAKASMSASPGMKLRISSPVRSSELRPSTALMLYLCQPDGHAESKHVHGAHGCQFELLQADRRPVPSRFAILTVGRAGTGAPSTYGEFL